MPAITRFLTELLWCPLYAGSERERAAADWETKFLTDQSKSKSPLTVDEKGERISYLLTYATSKFEEAQADKDRMEKRMSSLLTFCGGLVALVFAGIRLKYLRHPDSPTPLPDEGCWAYAGLMLLVAAIGIIAFATRGMRTVSTMSVSTTMDRAADWARDKKDLELLVAATTHKAVESLRYGTDWTHRRHTAATIIAFLGIACLAIDVIKG